jgi:hypothetical protein
MALAAILIIAVLIAVAVLIHDRAFGTKKDKVAYFATRYGNSVDRMIAESSVDRAQLRALRDSSRSGLVQATRQLMKLDPVPLDAAAEFIKRL